MTEEDFVRLGQHLSRVEDDVKKFAQIRGYTSVLLPKYSGNYPRIKLSKFENGYSYSISLVMECSLENKKYTEFFEEIPYYLTTYSRGTKKKYGSFEPYEYRPFNQIEKTFLTDLLQSDYRFESYINEDGEEAIGTATDYRGTNFSYNSFKGLHAIVEEFSKNFNYAYDYDPSDPFIPKIRLFKKVDGVLFNIFLRPDVGVGERFKFSEEFPHTLRYSRSFYEVDKDSDLVECCYNDAIFYEKKPFEEIANSFYEDLVYCDESIMSEKLEYLKIRL